MNSAYRMPGGGRRFARMMPMALPPNTGQNPPNGVVINYYLKDANDSTQLSIRIMDRNRKTIK
ncbi:MAG TPA: hypothetical protein PLR98_15310, partial [Chitinophagaceae bacterium]|nr:hypothetical protein [Chitinophagaceae bacterium]